jgi:hypothetical protein
MNDNLERLAAALSNAPRRVRELLAREDELDPEQWELVVEDTESLLRAVRAQLDCPTICPGESVVRLARACAAARLDFAPLGDAIERSMGFRPERLLAPSTTTMTATAKGATSDSRKSGYAMAC